MLNFLRRPRAPERSIPSRTIESYWRSLPKGRGLLPEKRDFNPMKIPALLPHILLAEVELQPRIRLLVRLTGDEVRDAAKADLRTRDLLETFAEDIRLIAAESVREVALRPCALWQRMPITHAEGAKADVEITAFPLAGPAAEGNGRVHLAILSQIIGVQSRLAAPGKPLHIESATHWHYIDVGAGVPEG